MLSPKYPNMIDWAKNKAPHIGAGMNITDFHNNVKYPYIKHCDIKIKLTIKNLYGIIYITWKGGEWNMGPLKYEDRLNEAKKGWSRKRY